MVFEDFYVPVIKEHLATFFLRDFLRPIELLLFSGAFTGTKKSGSKWLHDFFAQIFLLAMTYSIKAPRTKVIA